MSDQEMQSENQDQGQEEPAQEPETTTTEEVSLSSAVAAATTETNNEIVAELEKKFEDRYTEKDEAYKEVLNGREASPPVIPNFGIHSRYYGRAKGKVCG